ncbi:MAG: hypothetical protein QM831_17780 [Kofleriaceae bacterium]
MGRYLRGTNGFSYKYAFAEQENNLGELRDASSAGGGGLLPSFGGGYRDREENFDVPAIPLLRAIQRDGKAVGGEIDGVVSGDGDTVSDSLEFVQYALGENIVEVVLRLDAALEGVPFAVMLEGYATYDLAREDWPQLARYIDGFRDAKLDLAELKDEKRAEEIARELGNASAYLPAMALWILQHAVAHDLPMLSVYESQPSRYADNFWEGVTEWGPSIFYSPPSTPEEWFVRGLCEMFRKDAAAAQESLAQALKGGFERAKRWLEPDTNASDSSEESTVPPKSKSSTKSATKKSASKKPATKPTNKSATKKPATKSAKKSATKKPTKPTKKSASKKSTTSKTSASKTSASKTSASKTSASKTKRSKSSTRGSSPSKKTSAKQKRRAKK